MSYISDQNVTLPIKLKFARKKKSRKIHQTVVCLFVISLTSCGYLNKEYFYCSTEKAFFHFVNVSFTLLVYYELSQSSVALSTLFILYVVLNKF